MKVELDIPECHFCGEFFKLADPLDPHCDHFICENNHARVSISMRLVRVRAVTSDLEINGGINGALKSTNHVSSGNGYENGHQLPDGTILNSENLAIFAKK